MVWITAVCLVLAGVLLASYYAYRVAFYARGDHQAELYLLPLGEEHEQHRPQIREQMEYWAGKLAQAEAEEKNGGRNRAYRAVIRDV